MLNKIVMALTALRSKNAMPMTLQALHKRLFEPHYVTGVPLAEDLGLATLCKLAKTNEAGFEVLNIAREE